MSMRQVGVRALRAQLSSVLAEVEAGETVEITRDGKPVAQLKPVQQDIPPQIARLLAGGGVRWSGRRITHLPKPLELVGEGPTVTDILLADREYGVARHFMTPEERAAHAALPGQ